MTFVEKHRFSGDHTEQSVLRLSLEGEIFGVGLFEALVDKYHERSEILTAAATMEWLNVHLLEDSATTPGFM